jgi:REP element-mobilizing transposase RayT
LIVYACSILPEHLHMVIARHTCRIEQVANLLKGAATRELLEQGLHPFADQPYADGRLPTPWARASVVVFLSTDEQIRRAIRYVQMNPVKERMKEQNWKLVTPFVR